MQNTNPAHGIRSDVTAGRANLRPRSGLDKAVMQQLRDLAYDGRTVVVVTHSMANLDTCDWLLVLAPGGKMAFYGPPGEALRYFGLPG